MSSLFTSSSQSSRGARVSRKLHLLALALVSIRPASAIILSGCYSSSKPLTYSARWNYQSPSWCTTQCAGSAVFGLEGGYDCWCGNELPPADTEVDESNCNIPCTGYGQDACGGTGFYTVYITGTNPDVAHYQPSNSGSGGGNNNNNGGGGGSSSSEAPPSPSSSTIPSSTPQSSSAPAATTTQTSTATTIKHHKPSVITETQPGQTIVQTVGPSASPSGAPLTGSNNHASNSNGSSSGTNVAAVAAGVSVGVVALAAIVGGVFFWLRRRRQRSEGGPFDRSNRVGEFIRGPNNGGGSTAGSVAGDGLPPPSTAYSQMSDSRLEPQWGNNRSSVGSLMDDQDYSRRILRVANPDSG